MILQIDRNAPLQMLRHILNLRHVQSLSIRFLPGKPRFFCAKKAKKISATGAVSLIASARTVLALGALTWKSEGKKYIKYT